MLRIRGPINYPPSATPPQRRSGGGSSAVEAALLMGATTAEIMASTGATNSAVQSAKRKLRGQGKMK